MFPLQDVDLGSEGNIVVCGESKFNSDLIQEFSREGQWIRSYHHVPDALKKAGLSGETGIATAGESVFLVINHGPIPQTAEEVFGVGKVYEYRRGDLVRTYAFEPVPDGSTRRFRSVFSLDDKTFVESIVGKTVKTPDGTFAIVDPWVELHSLESGRTEVLMRQKPRLRTRVGAADSGCFVSYRNRFPRPNIPKPPYEPASFYLECEAPGERDSVVQSTAPSQNQAYRTGLELPSQPASPPTGRGIKRQSALNP